jgi:hypothetical protein
MYAHTHTQTRTHTYIHRLLPIPQHVLQEKAEYVVNELSNLYMQTHKQHTYIHTYTHTYIHRLLPIPQHVLQEKAEYVVNELSNLHQRLKDHPFCGELVRKFRGVEPTKEAINNLVAASKEEANRFVYVRICVCVYACIAQSRGTIQLFLT